MSQDCSVLLCDETTLIDETFRSTCQYEFVVPSASSSGQCLNKACLWLYKFVERIFVDSSSASDLLLHRKDYSHFLSLTFPHISLALPHLMSLEKGADALELRVDLLDDTSVQSVRNQLCLLRQHSALPVLFTVRTQNQTGRFPSCDSASIRSLLLLALRCGVEWLDVEATLPCSLLTDILLQASASSSSSKSPEISPPVFNYAKTTRLIGSVHSRDVLSRPLLVAAFESASLHGHAAVLKVVSGADNDIDCTNIQAAGNSCGKPFIGVCMGEKGVLSRALNKLLTPVCHPLQPTKAAPGQRSVTELMHLRALFVKPKPVDSAVDASFSPEQKHKHKHMYLFGSSIQYSLSPAMHNAAYRHLSLPHSYQLRDSPTVNSYSLVMQEPSFGGASVTIPHKESIQKLLDWISPAAQTIGAVNTIVVRDFDDVDGISDLGSRRRFLEGHNTDWIGIYRPLFELLKKRRQNKIDCVGEGLVLGGGTNCASNVYFVVSSNLQSVQEELLELPVLHCVNWVAAPLCYSFIIRILVFFTSTSFSAVVEFLLPLMMFICRIVCCCKQS